ncbi:MAG: hypothetical protein ACKOQY_10360 [Bacteroidota bacterium]
MRILLFCFIILSATPSFVTAQAQDERKWNPFFNLDQYASFIGNRGADVWGFRVGIEWNKTWRFGAGYNKLSSDIIEEKALPASELPFSDKDSVKAQLFFNFYPVMGEAIFFRKDPWQASAVFLMGYGQSYFSYYDRDNIKRPLFRRGVFGIQPGCNVQYKVIRWVGLTAGLGYRFMLINNPEIETRLDSPVLTLGVRLFLGEIWKSIRGKDSGGSSGTGTGINP